MQAHYRVLLGFKLIFAITFLIHCEPVKRRCYQWNISTTNEKWHNAGSTSENGGFCIVKCVLFIREWTWVQDGDSDHSAIINHWMKLFQTNVQRKCLARNESGTTVDSTAVNKSIDSQESIKQIMYSIYLSTVDRSAIDNFKFWTQGELHNHFFTTTHV